MSGHEYLQLLRGFESRFLGLAREEQGRVDVITNGKTVQMMDKVLRAHCDYKEHPEVWELGKPEQGLVCLLKTPPHGVWKYGDGISENFLERVRLCVREAGRALPDYPKGANSEDFWLHRLYFDLLENKSDLLFCASKEGGIIFSVCVASATFCARLERKTLELVESRAQQAPAQRVCESGSSFDPNENLRDAVLTKKARIAEIAGSTISRNIDTLRKECGWSFDKLAEKTGIDKKAILQHVNNGTTPRPSTLREYAQAFSKELGRKIAAPDLEK